MLIKGAPAKETAALAGKILGRAITIPKGFEKSTGEALEVEQSSFAYIFVHNFLPVLRNFSLIAIVLACAGYLAYRFIYTPFHAESLYKRGYERISAGEYQRANQLFNEAFSTRRKKDWFYKYAEAFRDEKRYMYAEEKYDELLRWYPRDKKGVLDYASLETNYLMNYAKADSLLRHELLDYAPDDREGLLAAGDNFLAWGETDPSKYEDARFSYARLLEKYGWTPPVVERMMKYFIRTDNLKEVLPLKDWFEASNKRRLSAPSLAELGGYLLDKQLEKAKGVPNAYVASIDGVRALLLEAVREQPSLPEPHYHLARYYNNLGNVREERITLENAIKAFDMAKEESIRRLGYRIDTHLRYANVLVNNREFFPAEEQLVRGISLYEDALTRNLVSRSPQYGKLYAGLGDLEYFVKTGSMETALSYYRRSEQNGWAPPEMQYRMGAAYYQLEDWKNALEYLFRASADLPLNRRLLFALGNAAYKRNDYFAAQGYYNRLLDILENQRSRLPVLLPNDRPEFLELGERLMMARNNAGVVYEALANQTGSRSYRSRAMSLYAESARAWDAITRSPTTMVRSPGVNLGFLNVTNALRPAAGYEPEIFIRIDKDVLEPSMWEELAPVAGLGGEAR
jgi:tetratricopeptide (TPR) repeat protein